MSDNLATFLLANSGGQSSRSVQSVSEVDAGQRGVPYSNLKDKTAGSTSLEAFPRILEGRSQHDDSTSSGLKEASLALIQAIEALAGNAGKEQFSTTETTQIGQTEAGQSLPDVGNFLPEKALQQLQAFLDPGADTNHVLPDQARQRIQQLLNEADSFKATDLALNAVTITNSSASNGLFSVNDLQARLATTAAAKFATTAEGIVPAVTGSTLGAVIAGDAAVKATTGSTSATDAATTARLAETMQQIAQVLRSVMPEKNVGKPVDTMAMADMVKSSRSLNLESRSGFGFESRQTPFFNLSQAHRPFQSYSAIPNDGEKLNSNLFLHNGLDQQSQSVKRFNAIQSATVVMEQVSGRAQSLSPAQGNVHSVEARDLTQMPWTTAEVYLKPGVEAQSVNARSGIGIQQSLQHPEWGRELGSRVVWMTKQQLQTANIKVNPPHLGPIEVRVVVQNDTANVSFISQHVAVRDVIESSVPRLREMLSENGLNLGNVDVNDHSSAREHQQQADTENDSLSSFRSASTQLTNEIELEDSGSAMNIAISQLGEGLIDYYV